MTEDCLCQLPAQLPLSVFVCSHRKYQASGSPERSHLTCVPVKSSAICIPPSSARSAFQLSVLGLNAGNRKQSGTNHSVWMWKSAFEKKKILINEQLIHQLRILPHHSQQNKVRSQACPSLPGQPMVHSTTNIYSRLKPSKLITA